MATATDSAQPISNALYASYGIVPRMPLLNLIGLPGATRRLRPAAVGCHRRPVRGDRGRPAGRTRSSRAHARRSTPSTASCSAWPTRSTIAICAQESRRGWLYRGPDDAALGYGYATEAGRVGPVASRDAALVTPILGHLMSAVQPRGAFALWLPGAADRAVDRGAACRVPTRAVPDPAVLGPPVRGLQPLPADLARPPVGPTLEGGRGPPDPTGPDHRPVRAMHRSSRLPDPTVDGSLGRTWLPSPCPRTELSRHPPATTVAGSLARGAERDHRPRTASGALHPPSGPASIDRAGVRGARRPRPPRRHEAVPQRQGRPARGGPGHPRGRLRVPRRARPAPASPRSSSC